MLKFVLDTNCVIDLEESRSDASHLEILIEEWKNGNVGLAIVAVSASENQQGGDANQNYSQFQTKLENAGLSGVYELLPIGKLDVFFWDHFLCSNDEMEQLEQSIRNILFPNTTTTPSEEITANSKWRNQMCDTLVAWACSYHGWDSLVTNDQNFHKKSEDLKQFGINKILTPEQAVKIAKS
ncbi:MAG: hypothetical protein ABJN96_06080 [Marinomonas sp.]